jgi:hypothetical protein
VVPVWYEALSNHSQIHSFFTYRGVPTALGIALFACAVTTLGRRGGPEAGRHEAAVPVESEKEGVS